MPTYNAQPISTTRFICGMSTVGEPAPADQDPCQHGMKIFLWTGRFRFLIGRSLKNCSAAVGILQNLGWNAEIVAAGLGPRNATKTQISSIYFGSKCQTQKTCNYQFPE